MGEDEFSKFLVIFREREGFRHFEMRPNFDRDIWPPRREIFDQGLLVEIQGHRYFDRRSRNVGVSVLRPAQQYFFPAFLALLFQALQSLGITDVIPSSIENGTNTWSKKLLSFSLDRFVTHLLC